jgi:hypothetical protein
MPEMLLKKLPQAFMPGLPLKKTLGKNARTL